MQGIPIHLKAICLHNYGRMDISSVGINQERRGRDRRETINIEDLFNIEVNTKTFPIINPLLFFQTVGINNFHLSHKNKYRGREENIPPSSFLSPWYETHWCNPCYFLWLGLVLLWYHHKGGRPGTGFSQHFQEAELLSTHHL